MDDIPICPEWWPHLLWRLHFPLGIPHPGPGPGPVNYPPIMNDILANLHIHTMSYLIMDKEACQQIRSVAEKRLTDAVRNLSKSHEQGGQRA